MSTLKSLFFFSGRYVLHQSWDWGLLALTYGVVIAGLTAGTAFKASTFEATPDMIAIQNGVTIMSIITALVTLVIAGRIIQNRINILNEFNMSTYAVRTDRVRAFREWLWLDN